MGRTKTSMVYNRLNSLRKVLSELGDRFKQLYSSAINSDHHPGDLCLGLMIGCVDPLNFGDRLYKLHGSNLPIIWRGTALIP